MASKLLISSAVLAPLFLLVNFSPLPPLMTWEIGVKVWDGTNLQVRNVCLKRIAGGYFSSCRSKNFEVAGANWAADGSWSSPDCNNDPNTICCPPRVTQTGTYRLSVGDYYQDFTILNPPSADIGSYFNTSTNTWSLWFNNGNYSVGKKGTAPACEQTTPG